MSFADYAFGNPHQIKGALSSQGSQLRALSIDGICGFADLFSLAPTQNRRFFHWMEQDISVNDY